MEMQHQKQKHTSVMGNMHYKKLALMALLSFIAMYILMYAMVDSFSNVLPNVNQFYMAGLMVMPMIIIELLIMGMMYNNKKINGVIIAGCSVFLLVFFFCIKQQAFVGDKQFLKSMIPHHGAAILMVEKASLKDPEIKKLSEGIISTQQQEIIQMKAKLKELNK